MLGQLKALSNHISIVKLNLVSKILFLMKYKKKPFFITETTFFRMPVTNKFLRWEKLSIAPHIKKSFYLKKKTRYNFLFVKFFFELFILMFWILWIVLIIVFGNSHFCLQSYPNIIKKWNKEKSQQISRSAHVQQIISNLICST